jgi:hypothetical protein
MNSNIHKLFGQKTNYYQIKALDIVSCSYLIITDLKNSHCNFSDKLAKHTLLTVRKYFFLTSDSTAIFAHYFQRAKTTEIQ